MGKGVPAAHWETMARKGFQLVYGATANLFVDRHGEYIGYGPEAAELVGLPEPETFQVLPWDTKVARVWCTCFRGREDIEDGGSYLTADCRNNLKLIQAEFTKRTGMHLRAGLEPEMIWLKADEDGKPTFEGMSKPYCYHIDQFSQFQPIIHKVIEYANAMGLDMIQGDHEDAPGQLELNFNFDVAEKHGRQPLHLPPGLQAGRARDAGLPVLHAQALHGRLGQRLPPQHLAVGRRRQQVHARARARISACPARSASGRSAASSSTSAR